MSQRPAFRPPLSARLVSLGQGIDLTAHGVVLWLPMARVPFSFSPLRDWAPGNEAGGPMKENHQLDGFFRGHSLNYDLVLQGYVAQIMCGPCETWSVARWNPRPDGVDLRSRPSCIGSLRSGTSCCFTHYGLQLPHGCATLLSSLSIPNSRHGRRMPTLSHLFKLCGRCG